MRKSWILLLTLVPFIAYGQMDSTANSQRGVEQTDSDDTPPPCPPKPTCKPKPACKPKPQCRPKKVLRPKSPCKPSCEPKPVCKPKPVCRPRPVCKPKPACCPTPQCAPKPACATKPVCQPPAVCPAEDFCCDQPSSFFATGQFLFWTAHEDGLNYAVTGVSVAGLSGDVAAGSTKQVSNKWRPAFRVGVGYGLPDKTWDVLVNWTRFEQNSHSTTSSSSTPTLTTNNALLGTWLSPKFTWNALNSANAHWHLLYNTVDVPFRRNIQICRDFVFSPHAGLKGAWINQRYNMNYAALTLPPTGVTEGTLPPLNASARNKNDFHSVGLRAGFDSEFHFNHHLSFYGNAAGSLVYGTFHVKERFTLNIVSPAPGAASTIDVINTKDKTHSVKPEIETAVGLRWQQDFCNTDLQLLVDIGYEFQLWVNQNQMLRFLNGNRTESPLHNGGDLSFQGLVVGAELRF